MSENPGRSAWTVDQLTKSVFFHQKLHEWGLFDVAAKIEEVQGEQYMWDRDELGISDLAWEKVVHRGIKPVRVFAHPLVLSRVFRSTGYYRTLAMVSQKSMGKIGLSVTSYESGSRKPTSETGLKIAQNLNRIISHLVETDANMEASEFDLWRGMAAGSQAQGSWNNKKG